MNAHKVETNECRARDSSSRANSKFEFQTNNERVGESQMTAFSTLRCTHSFVCERTKAVGMSKSG